MGLFMVVMKISPKSRDFLELVLRVWVGFGEVSIWEGHVGADARPREQKYMYGV